MWDIVDDGYIEQEGYTAVNSSLPDALVAGFLLIDTKLRKHILMHAEIDLLLKIYGYGFKELWLLKSIKYWMKLTMPQNTHYTTRYRKSMALKIMVRVYLYGERPSTQWLILRSRNAKEAAKLSPPGSSAIPVSS
ncbi:Uncharacterized protein Fot_53264 [Forsythia ovata]|uniref:Uncharacterized protein n=1 Tax=Forsythia ovata TaxID=205694 RepID=A0ABD1PI60_9LAMI